MRRTAALLLCLLACPGDSDDSTAASAPTCPDPQGCVTTATATATVTATTSTTATTEATTELASTTAPLPGATTTGGSDSGPPGTTGPTAPASTTDGPDDTTGAPVDCSDPTTCTECWNCARNGACKAAYEACAFQTFCVPTLACFESMCTDDGLQQGCADTCCKSCANLGTCDGVAGALDCILPMCAGLCGPAACPG